MLQGSGLGRVARGQQRGEGTWRGRKTTVREGEAHTKGGLWSNLCVCGHVPKEHLLCVLVGRFLSRLPCDFPAPANIQVCLELPPGATMGGVRIGIFWEEKGSRRGQRRYAGVFSLRVSTDPRHLHPMSRHTANPSVGFCPAAWCQHEEPGGCIKLAARVSSLASQGRLCSGK